MTQESDEERCVREGKDILVERELEYKYHVHHPHERCTDFYTVCGRRYTKYWSKK